MLMVPLPPSFFTYNYPTHLGTPLFGIQGLGAKARSCRPGTQGNIAAWSNSVQDAITAFIRQVGCHRLRVPELQL